MALMRWSMADARDR